MSMSRLSLALCSSEAASPPRSPSLLAPAAPSSFWTPAALLAPARARKPGAAGAAAGEEGEGNDQAEEEGGGGGGGGRGRKIKYEEEG